MIKVPYNRYGTPEVDWNLVSSCKLNQTRTREANGRNLVPLSYFKSGTKVKTEINVGIPMASPENVSPPPNHSAYTLNGMVMNKGVYAFGRSSMRSTESEENTK